VALPEDCKCACRLALHAFIRAVVRVRKNGHTMNLYAMKTRTKHSHFSELSRGPNLRAPLLPIIRWLTGPDANAPSALLATSLNLWSWFERWGWNLGFKVRPLPIQHQTYCAEAPAARSAILVSTRCRIKRRLRSAKASLSARQVSKRTPTP